MLSKSLSSTLSGVFLMKSLFSGLTTLALRFRAITLALVVLVSVAGIVAVTQLKQELIPSVEFPQTIILAEASGMTSDQVLDVLTKRLESALHNVSEIVNIESTTTGAFGSVITARNDFGVNQERLRTKIQTALDQVWLPTRQIAPPSGTDAQTFAHKLLGDMTPDVLIYLAESDPNFLFQLSPEVWQALPNDTVKTLLAYLAGQVQASAGQESALRRLVDQEVVPALENIPQVANVSVSGGQQLPGEGEAAATAQPSAAAEAAPSLLLQLTPAVWQIVAPKAGLSGALDDSVVQQLKATAVTIPTAPPPLPQSVAFFVGVDGKQIGPFDLPTLQTMASSGQFKRESLVWRQGMAVWSKAGEVGELSSVFASVPPPMPA